VPEAGPDRSCREPVANRNVIIDKQTQIDPNECDIITPQPTGGGLALLYELSEHNLLTTPLSELSQSERSLAAELRDSRYQLEKWLLREAMMDQDYSALKQILEAPGGADVDLYVALKARVVGYTSIDSVDIDYSQAGDFNKSSWHMLRNGLFDDLSTSLSDPMTGLYVENLKTSGNKDLARSVLALKSDVRYVPDMKAGLAIEERSETPTIEVDKFELSLIHANTTQGLYRVRSTGPMRIFTAYSLDGRILFQQDTDSSNEVSVQIDRGYSGIVILRAMDENGRFDVIRVLKI